MLSLVKNEEPTNSNGSVIVVLYDLKRQFSNSNDGFRKEKYKIYANTMAQVLELRQNSDELAKFMLASGIKKNAHDAKSWLTLEAIALVTGDRKSAWKPARVLDFAHDVDGVAPAQLAKHIAKHGGVEKMLKDITSKCPRRKKEVPPSENKLGKTLKKLKAGSNAGSENILPPKTTEMVLSINEELNSKLLSLDPGVQVKPIGTRIHSDDVWVGSVVEVNKLVIVS